MININENVEEIIKKAVEKSLREVNLNTIWYPSSSTVQRKFIYDLTAILNCNENFDGIIALSLPQGVVYKINKMTQIVSSSIENPISIIDKIGRRIAVCLSKSNMNFRLSGVISRLSDKYPAPIPRRLIPFVTNQGNMVIEMYLRKSSTFHQDNEWWRNYNNFNLEN